MRRLLLAALLACLASCAGSQARATYGAANNTTVAVVNSGSQLALDAMCASELHALGHEGRRVNGVCARSDAPRAATPEQRAAFEHVRDAWRTVRDAHAAVADAQAAVALVVEAGDSAAEGALDAAIVRLGFAYVHLREACATLGVALPELPGWGAEGAN